VGKRYESVDATGKHAYMQDGMEVYEQDDGLYRVCWNPARLRDESAWVKRSFDTVDAAFEAGDLVREAKGDG
jgi:hypothetical protein